MPVDPLQLDRFAFHLPPGAEPPEAGEGDVLDCLADLLIDVAQDEEAQTDDPTSIDPDPDDQRGRQPHR